ncbi:MAG: transposase [Paracoccus sp. (in: a-proteobacteria)]
MGSYQRGGHRVWDSKYHLVWLTKYRCEMPGGDVGDQCRELIRETVRAHEMMAHAGSVNRNYIHLLVSVTPNLTTALTSREPAAWQTDPALSCNLKPPAFSRWSIHSDLHQFPPVTLEHTKRVFRSACLQLWIIVR